MLKITETKSGLPNVIADEVNLHSPYDPVKESRRFIAGTVGEPFPSCIILMGAALDYLTEACLECFPACRVICIFYNEQLFHLYINLQRRPSHPLSVCWHPGLDLSLADFLKNRLSEWELDGLVVREWKPCTRAFPAAAGEYRQILSKIITELRSSLVTISTFGRLWMRNTLANFLDIDTVIRMLPCQRSYPIVIAASGPSLERAVDVLIPLRPYFTLWALPSSIPLLIERQLVPDLVIVTDPGYYSLAHLAPIRNRELVIACPLSAVRGLGQCSSRIYLFRQPHFFEEAFLKRSVRTLPLLLPPQGTVAASALQLALASTDSEIIFCGLDFCHDDIKAHAFPHLSQWLCQIRETRLNPVYDQLFKLAREQAPLEIVPGQKQITGRLRRQPSSAPLLAYANWFSRLGYTGRSQLFRLLPEAVPVSAMSALDGAGFKSLVKKYPHALPPLSTEYDPEYPSHQTRVQITLNVLKDWDCMLSTGLGALKKLCMQEQLDALTANSMLFEFLYFYDLAGLLGLKKRLRLPGTISGAAHTAGELLENALLFIRELDRKVSDNARAS